MKRYLRLGPIPTNEKSINWYKASLDAAYDFTYALDLGDSYEDACRFAGIKDEWFEDGVSVFDLDESGNPILNDELKKTFDEYKDNHKAFILAGDVAGRGCSGDPLLRNVVILEEL